MQRSIDKTPAEHFHQICCRWMKKTCTTKIIYSYALVMSLKTFWIFMLRIAAKTVVIDSDCNSESVSSIMNLYLCCKNGQV